MTERGQGMQAVAMGQGTGSFVTDNVVNDCFVTERLVTEIISRATLVPQDRLTPDARPEDLGIDSLGLVEAIFALEEALDIKVPFNAHQASGGSAAGFDISSIGSITAGVQALVAARRAA